MHFSPACCHVLQEEHKHLRRGLFFFLFNILRSAFFSYVPLRIRVIIVGSSQVKVYKVHNRLLFYCLGT